MGSVSLPKQLKGYSHSIDAFKYCVEVTSGKIPACEEIILVCQYFIDLFDSDEYHYDPQKADRACQFIELLPHVKGRWAAKKSNLILAPWQKFIICGIFGWVDDEGLRKHRIAYVKIPRKNGKSILAAAIGLYMLVADGEYGSEVYSGATNEKQAWEVFRPAKLMAQRAEDFSSSFGLDVNAKSLIRAEDFSKFEPMIGNPGDGSSPHCAIHDEFHEHDNPDQLDTMRTGMGARDQPLQLIITTAGSNIGGPCFEEEREAVKSLKSGDLANLFPVMYGIDQDDDWSTVESARKANPNFGVSVSEKFLLEQLDLAKKRPAKQNAYRTKHLNQWVGAKSAWMNILAWLAQKKTSKFDQFQNAPCHAAVDLASRKDVSVICLLWKNGQEYYTKQWFFVPESAVEENEKYRELEAEGCLIVTPGNKTDQAFIEEKCKELQKEYDIESWAFDDYQGDYIMTRLDDEGFNVVNYAQTVKNMSAPMKEVEAQILDRKLYHDGNKCMDWMMGNVVCKRDAKDNIYPRKENDNDQKCKIDGPVALIMAMGRWLANDSEGCLDDYLDSVT